MKVYENREKAIEACKKTHDAMEEVLDKHSSWMDIDDSCVNMYVCVFYLDTHGKQQTFSYYWG